VRAVQMQGQRVSPEQWNEESRSALADTNDAELATDCRHHYQYNGRGAWECVICGDWTKCD
jgi:hypothetical protein